jgi:hypothetical protein
VGFRFHRSIRILPGVRLNLSKSGLSTSFGERGFTVNVGPHGTRTTAGIPGTGLSYVATHGAGHTRRSSGRAAYRQLVQEHREQDKRTRVEEARVGHDLREARLEALGSVLAHRVRTPYDWPGHWRPRVYSAALKPSPPAPLADREVKRAAAQQAPMWPYFAALIVFVLLYPVVRGPLGMAALVVCAVGAVILVVRNARRRPTIARAWRESWTERDEKQRRNDAADYELHEAKRRGDFAREEEWRNGVWTAADREDPEPLTAVLEAELSTETFPVPLVCDVSLDSIDVIDIELTLPDLDAIPEESSKVTSTGVLSLHAMAQRDRTALYKTLCAGMALRLVYDAFRVLSMVTRARVTGFTSDVDPATGHEREFVALRVSATRAEFGALALDNLEPVAALEGLGGELNCDRAGKLTPLAEQRVEE